MTPKKSSGELLYFSSLFDGIRYLISNVAQLGKNNRVCFSWLW